MEPFVATYSPRDRGFVSKLDVRDSTSGNDKGGHVRCFGGRKFNGPSESMQFAPRGLIQ